MGNTTISYIVEFSIEVIGVDKEKRQVLAS